jgi:O-antigen ligase
VLGVLTVRTLIVANSLLGVFSTASLPTIGNAQVLSVRPDFAATACGVTAAACLHLLLTRRHRPWATAGLVALGTSSAVVVFAQESRAGMLAGLTALAGAVVAAAWGRVSRLTLLGTAAAGLAVMAALLTWTATGERLVNGVTGHGEGSGTVNARQTAYELVGDYTLEEPSRALVGVRFGPDFLTDSGAVVPLSGTDYEGVRSPHNYWLGTWARLGVPGLALVIAIAVLGAVAAVRVLRAPSDVLTAVAAGCLLAIPVVSMFGVVLEAPSGAVPYFWAAGHVSAVLLRRSTPERQGPSG